MLIATVFFSVFLMLQLPGDPFLDERGLNKKIHSDLIHKHGLDQSTLQQSWRYLVSISKFDLGRSYVYRDRTVQSIITETFPISATLGATAAVIAIFGGLIWGILSYSTGIRLGVSSLALAVPSFILAAVLQYFLAVEWKLFPIARWGTAAQAVLPVIALSARPMAFIAKMIRSNLAESDHLNFILSARVRGLSPFRVLFYHQLPYAFLPLIGYLSQMIATILVGSFVIEKIFSIPGLGFWFVNGVINRDYPLIVGTTLFFNALLIVITLIGELVTLASDPRLREAEA